LAPINSAFCGHIYWSNLHTTGDWIFYLQDGLRVKKFGGKENGEDVEGKEKESSKESVENEEEKIRKEWGKGIIFFILKK
jgi:hypothetical protein